MQAFAAFLNAFLTSLLLIAESCAIGGLVFGLVILKAGRGPLATGNGLAHFTIAFIRTGAVVMAAAQLAELAANGWLLAETINRSPLPAYLHTLHFQAGLARGLLAGALAWATLRLERRPEELRGWAGVTGMAVLLVLSGAWLVHAAGRIEGRLPLMAMTVLHQLGANVWMGGILLLVALWRRGRKAPELRALWPVVLRGFAWVGGGSVLLLLAAGIPLALRYIGSWRGLIGTAYGSLVLAKGVLLAIALGLAAFNFFVSRQPPAASTRVWQRVPYYLEAEALILSAILFTAAGLASLPPAVDIDEQQATWAEVVVTFSPKMPRLKSPSFEEAIAAYYEKPTIPTAITAGVETYWSDYNHNVAGLFLVAMGGVALLSFFKIGRWTYYWPLGFIGIGIFQWLRSDVESSPFGPMGFWERFLAESETLGHRLSIVLVLALGVLELRARTTGKPDTRLPYVFPVLCAIGGLLLLGHSHSAFELKQDYLIQVTHTAMGSLAVIMACGRWLELRLRPSVGPGGAGLASILAMLGIGLILLFYRETPVA